MAYSHPGPKLRAAASAIREAMNTTAPGEREAKLNLALLLMAEAMEATSKMWHG